MMEITVHVCGDHWVAMDQTLEKIRQTPSNEIIVLDLRGEGANLTRLGLADEIVATGRDPDTVYIKSWSNNLDTTPFQRINRHQISHFFWMSKQYHQGVCAATHERKFGMFCGRLTHARAAMVYDSWHRLQDRILFSVMRSPVPPPWAVSATGKNLECLDDWIDPCNQAEFKKWWAACPVTSIDDHCLSDQYDAAQNTNRDLLAHYHRFDIEIVMETVTLGPAFFPTEKTVRPITAAKPMLVYAPKGYLENLRNLGFETWHTCWDESYDQLEGPARWQAMRDLMQQDLWADPEIAEHNLSNLQRLIEKYQPQ
jgi:hypothetical protein